jgi:hypothetical protein
MSPEIAVPGSPTTEDHSPAVTGAKQPVVVRRDIDGGRDANTIYETFSPNERMAPAAAWNARLGPLLRRAPVLLSVGICNLIGIRHPAAPCLRAPAGRKNSSTRICATSTSNRSPGPCQIPPRQTDHRIHSSGGHHARERVDLRTSGVPEPAGIGMVVQFHLWGGKMRGLFAINAPRGTALPKGAWRSFTGPSWRSVMRRPLEGRDPQFWRESPWKLRTASASPRAPAFDRSRPDALEEQALTPMFSQTPLELGTTTEFLKIACSDVLYGSLFNAAVFVYRVKSRHSSWRTSRTRG